MELNQLKNTWKKVSEKETKANDAQILKLLKDSNQSALSRVISLETIAFKASFILPVIFILINVLVYLMFPEFGKGYVFYLSPLLVLYCVSLGIWQSFKLKYLKKIDIVNDGILSVSKFINKYRRLSVYEAVIGLVWLISFIYTMLVLVFPDYAIFEYLLFGGFALILLILGFFFTRSMYKDTFGVIKRNLKEMKDFEMQTSPE